MKRNFEATEPIWKIEKTLACVRCEKFYGDKSTKNLCSVCHASLHGAQKNTLATRIAILEAESNEAAALDLLHKTRYVLLTPNQITRLTKTLMHQSKETMAKILLGKTGMTPFLFYYTDYIKMCFELTIGGMSMENMQKRFVLFEFCFDFWKINTRDPVHCYNVNSAPMTRMPSISYAIHKWYRKNGMTERHMGGIQDRTIVSSPCTYCKNQVTENELTFCKCGIVCHLHCFLRNAVEHKEKYGRYECNDCKRKLTVEYLTVVKRCETDSLSDMFLEKNITISEVLTYDDTELTNFRANFCNYVVSRTNKKALDVYIGFE